MNLYVAYGSNLNIMQMSYRCPGATVAFTGFLLNWKLVYKGSRTGSYATIKNVRDQKFLSLYGTSLLVTKRPLICTKVIQDFIKSKTYMFTKITELEKKLWFIFFQILLRLAFHPIGTFKLYCKDMMIWDLM